MTTEEPASARPSSLLKPTFIRVKRKRTEQPADTLVIVENPRPTKRVSVSKLASALRDLTSIGKEKEEEDETKLVQQDENGRAGSESEISGAAPRRRLFRLAHSTTAGHPAELAIKRAQQEAKLRRAKEEEEEEEEEEGGGAPSYHIVDLEKQGEASYLPSSTSQKASRERPTKKTFTPNLKQGRQRAERTPLLQKEAKEEEMMLANYLPMLRDYLHEQGSTLDNEEEELHARWQGSKEPAEARIRGKDRSGKDKDKEEEEEEDGEYVYDIYYFDDNAQREELDDAKAVISIESFSARSLWHGEYDPSDSEDETDDSNAADQSDYEYPEEEDSSQEEGIGREVDLSSDDEDDRYLYGYRKLKGERYGYDGLGAEEGEEEEEEVERHQWEAFDEKTYPSDEEFSYDGNEQSRIQPDFDFFHQHWHAMRK